MWVLDHLLIVSQAPRLELSLLQRRDYSLALVAYVSFSQWAGVAQCTKHFWGDISPYSIVSAHVALLSTEKRRCRLPFPYSFKLTFKNLLHSLFHFPFTCTLCTSLRLIAPPSRTWETSLSLIAPWNEVLPLVQRIIPALAWWFVWNICCDHSAWVRSVLDLFIPAYVNRYFF